uniref:hypothetical protein n=1 Tax=Actinoplanes sp. CA-084688 TaxID=3239901 RepID=UPI003F498234
MSAWHLDDALADRYAGGSTDLVLAASVEAHLQECGTCRDRITGVVPTQRLDDIWARVADKLEASPTLAERLRQRLQVRPLSARFAIGIALAAAAVFAVVAMSIGLSQVPGDAGAAPPSPAWTGPAIQNIKADNDPGLAALTADLTAVNGQLISSYDPPPYRITLDDAPHTSATIAERNLSGLNRKAVSRAAVIHTASGTWIYTITGPHLIVRQPVTVTAENDHIAILADGPPAGTKVLTFTID